MATSFLPRYIRTVADGRMSTLFARASWAHKPTCAASFHRPSTGRGLHHGDCLLSPISSRRRNNRPQFSANSATSSVNVQVSVLVEGDPRVSREEFNRIMDSIEHDSRAILHQALSQEAKQTGPTSKTSELSLVLCDDVYMRQLNLEWRGKDSTTDVLSFEFPSDEYDLDMPVRCLGDVVVSLEQADRQARDRRGIAPYNDSYSLQDELRVLLIHGVLHLIGFDHELGPGPFQAMALEEARIMSALGWQGAGLLEASGHPIDDYRSSSDGSFDASEDAYLRDASLQVTNDIDIVCLDMDGTLLDSGSRVSPATVEALKANLGRDGKTIMVATGKCRPAAIAACRAVGLAGPGLLVDEKGPGIFLQGLAVYGPTGELLPGGSSLPAAVVRTCFEYSEACDVSCVAFLGDTCVTLRMTDELRELHTRYFEPLAEVAESIEAILAGPAVKKILFMADERRIDNEVIPHFYTCLAETDTELTQAVPTMLEVLPGGANKWTGLQEYLAHTGQSADNVMAIGDGMNDYELLLNVGFSVAMANAVQDLMDVADHVTASNDEDGVALAISKFLK